MPGYCTKCLSVMEKTGAEKYYVTSPIFMYHCRRCDWTTSWSPKTPKDKQTLKFMKSLLDTESWFTGIRRLDVGKSWKQEATEMLNYMKKRKNLLDQECQKFLRIKVEELEKEFKKIQFN